jgi:hypothetical protein
LEALENFNYEIPEPDYTGYIEKKRFDEVASELAEWKRKHKALLTEEEQKAQEREEELATLRREVEETRKERVLSEHKAQYIAMGYDEELAEDTAKASIEGDTNRVFSNHRKFLEAHDKDLELKLIAKSPRPDGTGAKNSEVPKTKAEIMAVKDNTERQQLIAQNIELFKK